MIRRQITHRSRNRRAIQETAPARPGDIEPTIEVEVGETSFVLTSDFALVVQPFPVGDLGGLVVSDGNGPVSIANWTQLTPTTVRFQASAPMVDTVQVTFPPQWPFIRTAMGGYLLATTASAEVAA